jgi:chromosomal replication initiator protein
LAYPELTFTPEVWDGVLHRLQSEVPAFTFETWLQPLQPRRLDEGLLLVCPSTFHRERIRRHFLPRIDACLREETGEGVEIALGIDPSATPSIQSAPSREESSRPKLDGSGQADRACESPTAPREGVGAKQAADADARAKRSPLTVADRPVPLQPIPGHSASIPSAPISSTRMRSVPLPPGRRARAPAGEAPGSAPPDRRSPGAQYTFESFVVGPCNALAREASFSLARGQQQALNQIYLRADAGMGKTHLARAVAAEAARLGNGEVKYLSSENFTNQFLSALRSNRTSDFKRRYRGRHQLFVMEDIQFLEGKTATQLEFFHTVQHILDAGGRILLTGDRLPQDMPQLSPRIRSQLDSGFLAELEPPDPRVRRAILRSKAASGGVGLPAQCLDALVENIRGSVRELEGVLIQLVTTASLLKRPIDLKLTESAIAKKTSAVPRRRRLGVGDVIGVVAGFFQSSPDQLASRSRRKQILLPRQLAMYLCRRYTDAPVGEIGQALGRDHPAVRNAIEKIERGILERPPLRYQVEALGERLDALLAELDS